MHRYPLITAALLVFAVPFSSPAHAEQRVVATADDLTAALEAAAPGDEIVLNPGTYAGGLYRENLRDVTIRSADVTTPAVIEGGGFGLMLSSPVNVTLINLIFQNQAENGINIDDGGSQETPATGIALIGITVRDIQNAGNHDGIKLAGVRDFVIDGVTVQNWGNDGSAIDFVGCHHGLVQNALLKHDGLTVGGSGIRPKGGSKDIVIRANRIEFPVGNGRALQLGGRTSAEFFRFVDGDADYEASEIVMEGNVVIGGSSAFSWVNIDGGIVHHNVVYRPGQWVMRILNENEGTSIVPTRNGQLLDNDIVFNDTDDEFNRAVNESDAVEPGTFQFARNRWHNLANPTPKGSRPALPGEESDGIYGEEPLASVEAPQVWQFPWGKWVVNANPARMTVDIEGYESLQAAVPGKGSKFEPLLDDPLTGTWTALDLGGGTAELQPMSQLILIDRSACAGCAGR